VTEPVALFRVGGVAVWDMTGGLCYQAGCAVDADGSPRAYHPPTPEHPSGRPPALDVIANAGHPGDWWGLACDKNGLPYKQGPGDPAPGFYVSTTALIDPTMPESDPRRYVDAETVPYASIPNLQPLLARVGPGDLGVALYKQLTVPFIIADVGPRDEIGEGSPALLKELGLWAGMNAGHDRQDIVWVLFPKTRTRPRWPRTREDIRLHAQIALANMGGRSRFEATYPSLRAA